MTTAVKYRPRAKNPEVQTIRQPRRDGTVFWRAECSCGYVGHWFPTAITGQADAELHSITTGHSNGASRCLCSH